MKHDKYCSLKLPYSICLLLDTKCLVGITTLLDTKCLVRRSNEYKLVELFSNITTINHVGSNEYKPVEFLITQ